MGPNNSVVRLRNRKKKRGDAYSGSTNTIIQNMPSILQNMPSIWLPRIIFFIQLLSEKSSQYIENWHAEENWNVQRNNPVLFKRISSNFIVHYHLLISLFMYLFINLFIYCCLPAVGSCAIFTRIHPCLKNSCQVGINQYFLSGFTHLLIVSSRFYSFKKSQRNVHISINLRNKNMTLRKKSSK